MCDCSKKTCKCKDGLNSFTKTTAVFIQPAVNGNVTINVSELGQFTGSWGATGQIIFIEFGGYYRVVSSTNNTITITNLGYTGNLASGGNIPVNSKVSPSGIKGLDGECEGCCSSPTKVLLEADFEETDSYTALLTDCVLIADPGYDAASIVLNLTEVNKKIIIKNINSDLTPISVVSTSDIEGSSSNFNINVGDSYTFIYTGVNGWYIISSHVN